MSDIQHYLYLTAESWRRKIAALRYSEFQLNPVGVLHMYDRYFNTCYKVSSGSEYRLKLRDMVRRIRSACMGLGSGVDDYAPQNNLDTLIVMRDTSKWQLTVVFLDLLLEGQFDEASDLGLYLAGWESKYEFDSSELRKA